MAMISPMISPEARLRLLICIRTDACHNSERICRQGVQQPIERVMLAAP